MPPITVEARTVAGSSLALGSSGPGMVTIDRSKRGGGLGPGWNRGQVLLLAIGRCLRNHRFREPASGLTVGNVQVRANADGTDDPVPAQTVSFSAAVGADATDAEVFNLIQATDGVAEIPNPLRLSTEVKLAGTKVIARR